MYNTLIKGKTAIHDREFKYSPTVRYIENSMWDQLNVHIIFSCYFALLMLNNRTVYFV